MSHIQNLCNCEIQEHTCINKAIRAAQEASSLTEPIHTFIAAQSTKAKPNTVVPPSNPQDPYIYIFSKVAN